MSELTQARLKELLHYDPETGAFTWATGGKRKRKGAVAGNIHWTGYRRICLEYKSYLGQRLAWLYMTGEWPPEEVDHINRDVADNRFDNLRLACKSENAGNTRRRVNNRSGVKGVSWHSAINRWRARVQKNGKCVYYEAFDTLEEAAAAYERAAKRIFGEFARTDAA